MPQLVTLASVYLTHFQFWSAVGPNVRAHLLATGLKLASGLRGKAPLLHLLPQLGAFLHARRHPASNAERRGHGRRWHCPHKGRGGAGEAVVPQTAAAALPARGGRSLTATSGGRLAQLKDHDGDKGEKPVSLTMAWSPAILKLTTGIDILD